MPPGHSTGKVPHGSILQSFPVGSPYFSAGLLKEFSVDPPHLLATPVSAFIASSGVLCYLAGLPQTFSVSPPSLSGDLLKRFSVGSTRSLVCLPTSFLWDLLKEIPAASGSASRILCLFKKGLQVSLQNCVPLWKSLWVTL
ncbi:hypothetical protein XENOCAPTIV_023267 [Xenoophorus captivus]|uniref:Uncharacterized protein n=1 Tax=Xenoophorus captivus TaxID=1517983 RepID=A0ABV0QL07_9TELE